jgi:hypothetical protein
MIGSNPDSFQKPENGSKERGPGKVAVSPAKNVTEIICIVDRNSLVATARSDPVGAFNRFLADQQTPDDPTRLTMVLFGDQCEIVHNGVPIRNVPPLIPATFMPPGKTGLFDAIGTTLNTVSARLAGIPVDDQPEKMIVIILTCGNENASREFSLPATRLMIDRFMNKLKWDCIFLAATADGISDAELIGIRPDKIVRFSPDPAGICKVCEHISNAVAMKRRGEIINSWQKRYGMDAEP